MPRQTARDITNALTKLREFIDTTDDIIAGRIAYTVETAVRWTQENTVDWPPLIDDVSKNADILFDELKKTR